MMEIEIPGGSPLRLEHAVFDYNGTLALDGRLLEPVRGLLMALSAQLRLHVVTADTFGSVRGQLDGLPAALCVIPQQAQALAKLAYIRQLGAESVVAFGNGRNDGEMLRTAALGIALVQDEGCAVQTLLGADVVAPDIASAIGLLLHPARLVATLRG